jgi:hypothetical protein
MNASEQLRDFSAGDLITELKARANFQSLRTNFDVAPEWALLQELKLEELRSGKHLTKDELLEELALRCRPLHEQQTAKEGVSEKFRDFDSLALYRTLTERAAAWRMEVLNEMKEESGLGDEKFFAVYGKDDRYEAGGEETGRPFTTLVGATVLIEAASDLTPVGGGKFRLRTVSLNEWCQSVKGKPLCAGTRFMSQPCSPDCSGVLIAPDIVLTAGHAVMHYKNNINDRRFIFEFWMLDNNTARLEFPAEMVYSGKEIIDWRATWTGPDWALVRLDRPVTGRQHLGSFLRRSGKVGDRATLYALGHPTGLPMKWAVGRVRDNSGDERIETNLDTFAGNSGSPVFSIGQGAKIEGSLIGGEEDYVQVGDCYQVKQCSDEGCMGEMVQRISEVLPFIP